MKATAAVFARELREKVFLVPAALVAGALPFVLSLWPSDAMPRWTAEDRFFAAAWIAAALALVLVRDSRQLGPRPRDGGGPPALLLLPADRRNVPLDRKDGGRCGGRVAVGAAHGDAGDSRGRNSANGVLALGAHASRRRPAVAAGPRNLTFASLALAPGSRGARGPGDRGHGDLDVVSRRPAGNPIARSSGSGSRDRGDCRDARSRPCGTEVRDARSRRSSGRVSRFLADPSHRRGGARPRGPGGVGLVCLGPPFRAVRRGRNPGSPRRGLGVRHGPGSVASRRGARVRRRHAYGSLRLGSSQRLVLGASDLLRERAARGLARTLCELERRHLERRTPARVRPGLRRSRCWKYPGEARPGFRGPTGRADCSYRRTASAPPS